MNRRSHIFFSLLALSNAWWSGGAYAQFIPHDLEPERIRPQSTIPLPHIETVPDAVDYFLEPGNRELNPGKTYRMVHLRIPKAPYFNKNSWNGPVRTYGLHITMFYPNFSGLADPENAECSAPERFAHGKGGYCRRELTVGMRYASKTNLHLSYEIFKKDFLQGYAKPVDQKSRYPGLELVGTDITDIGNRYYETRDTYYLSRNPSTDQPELVITCSEFVPSPSCKTTFPSGKSRYIQIDFTFVLSLLPQWREVIDRTREKVDSMIVTTYEVPR